MRRSQAPSMIPIGQAPTLDIIDESDAESGFLRDATGLNRKKSETRGQHGLIQLQSMEVLEPPVAANFSDLSSIMAMPHELVDALVNFNFEPATREQCMMSIPFSESILKDLVNKVVDNDEKREKISRRRAIRLAISHAWTLAFNNQFFNDKKARCSLNESMKIDLKDAENEPIPAPIDNYVAQIPRTKVKKRPPPPVVIKLLKKPKSQKRFGLNSPRKRMSDFQKSRDFSISQSNFNYQTKQNVGDKKIAIEKLAQDQKQNTNKGKRTTRRMTTMGEDSISQNNMHELQMMSLSNKRTKEAHRRPNLKFGATCELSDMLSGSFSSRSSRRQGGYGYGAGTTSPHAFQAVLLHDYYTDYDDHSSVEPDQTEDWSSIILKRKKTIIRSSIQPEQKGQMKKSVIRQDIYGQVKTREKLHTNSVVSHLHKKTLNEVIFDTEAFVHEKKTDLKLQTEIAIQDARLKLQAVQFKHDGPTMVEEEAPGFPVQKSQNKKYNRVKVKVQVSQSSRSQLNQSKSISRQHHPSKTEASIEGGAGNNGSKMITIKNDNYNNNVGSNQPSKISHSISGIQDSKVLGTAQNSKVLDQSTADNQHHHQQQNSNQSRHEKKNSMSERLKTAFLKKLEQQSYSSQSQSTTDPKKMAPSMLSQLLKDALLKKLFAMEQKYSKRGSLMPSALKFQFRAQQAPPMIGSLQPYNVKYKTQSKPQFCIDQDTLKMRKLSDCGDTSDPEADGDFTTKSRKSKADPGRLFVGPPIAKTARDHIRNNSDEALFGRLIDQSNGKKNGDEIGIEIGDLRNFKSETIPFKRRAFTNVRKALEFTSKRSHTLDHGLDFNQYKEVGQHLQGAQQPQKMSLWHEKKRKMVSIQKDDVDRISTDESAAPQIAFIEQNGNIQEMDDKTDAHKKHLSVIMQRNDESEQLSPLIGNTADRKIHSRNKTGKSVTLLPPIRSSTSLNQLKTVGSHKQMTTLRTSYDKVKVNKPQGVLRLTKGSPRATQTLSQPLSMPNLLSESPSLLNLCMAGSTPKRKEEVGNSAFRSNTAMTKNAAEGSRLGHNNQQLNQQFSTQFSTQLGSHPLSGRGRENKKVASSSIFKTAGQESLLKSLKPLNPTRANLIKTIEQKPRSTYTDKIEIKNLELSKRLALEMNNSKTERQNAQYQAGRQFYFQNLQAKKSHGLLNVGGIQVGLGHSPKSSKFATTQRRNQTSQQSLY